MQKLLNTPLTAEKLRQAFANHPKWLVVLNILSDPEADEDPFLKILGNSVTTTSTSDTPERIGPDLPIYRYFNPPVSPKFFAAKPIDESRLPRILSEIGANSPFVWPNNASPASKCTNSYQ